MTHQAVILAGGKGTRMWPLTAQPSQGAAPGRRDALPRDAASLVVHGRCDRGADGRRGPSKENPGTAIWRTASTMEGCGSRSRPSPSRWTRPVRWWRSGTGSLSGSWCSMATSSSTSTPRCSWRHPGDGWRARLTLTVVDDASSYGAVRLDGAKVIAFDREARSRLRYPGDCQRRALPDGTERPRRVASRGGARWNGTSSHCSPPRASSTA